MFEFCNTDFKQRLLWMRKALDFQSTGDELYLQRVRDFADQASQFEENIKSIINPRIELVEFAPKDSHRQVDVQKCLDGHVENNTTQMLTIQQILYQKGQKLAEMSAAEK